MTSFEPPDDSNSSRKQPPVSSEKKPRRTIRITGKLSGGQLKAGQTSTVQQRQVTVSSTSTIEPDTMSEPMSPADDEHRQ